MSEKNEKLPLPLVCCRATTTIGSLGIAVARLNNLLQYGIHKNWQISIQQVAKVNVCTVEKNALIFLNLHSCYVLQFLSLQVLYFTICKYQNKDL